MRFSSLLGDCNAGCLWKFRVCTSFSASYSSSSSTLLRLCSVEESELRVPSSSRLPSSTSLQSSLLMSTFLLSLFDVSSHLVYSFSCFVPSFRSLALDRSTLFFLFLKAVHSIVYCSTLLGLLLVSVEDGQQEKNGWFEREGEIEGERTRVSCIQCSDFIRSRGGIERKSTGSRPKKESKSLVKESLIH